MAASSAGGCVGDTCFCTSEAITTILPGVRAKILSGFPQHSRCLGVMRFWLLPVFASLFSSTIVRAGDFRAFLDSYCLECHDAEVKKGGVDLSVFADDAAVMRHRVALRSVFEKIESKQMPPPKEETQPSPAQRQEVLAWMMDIAAKPDPALSSPDPGRPEMRRLTRLEYNNAIRDLFGLEMDVFMFPERLPVRDKAYFQPGSGQMGTEITLEMREYGAGYRVLCPQLGLPGDSRAEHGFRNRGDAMDFSPLLLESYLVAAQEIVNAPALPTGSRVFADLIGVDISKLAATNKKPSQTMPLVPLVAAFAADRESMPEAAGNSLTLAAFRQKMTLAFAQGIGGVMDVPQALMNQTVAGKGGLLKGSFGTRGFTVNPNEDLWLVGFATATATSAPGLLTNHVKGLKRYELTFDIVSEDEHEGIEHLGLCVLGRKGQSGTLILTAVLSDATEQLITLQVAEGEAGTAFVSFTAGEGESVRRLIVDGSGINGDYILLDDLAVITNGVAQALPLVQKEPPPKAANQRLQTAVQTRAPASQRLTAFAAKAYRRPLSSDEEASLTALYEQSKAAGASEADATRHGIAAVLASPAFLYVEANGKLNSGKVAALEDHELATRLALFLWASTPDDELLALATSGELSDPATLESQTRRMLKDPRSRELSESFATQWLRLDQLFSSKPDRDIFKDFYSDAMGKATLHGAVLSEALLLFETVHVEDRSILDFLAADYTWLNPQISQLYGMTPANAPSAAAAPASNRELQKRKAMLNARWQRVKLPDATRGGFMTMAAPMIVTSLPFRTSPVKRGAWMLETIFNRPPSEPKVAFAIENDTKEAALQMSIRQRFEAHRSKAACYSCHIRLDPPGFALERFDPIGAWDKNADAKSEWNGQPFDGPAEFKKLLAQEPHEFTRGFIEHLISYALGRAITFADMPTIEKIQQAAKADGWKFSRIVVEIAKSYPFTHTRLPQ
jgi:hypothetical protein